MIPKVIHYCWFGRNPLPPLAIKCIESWKKYLPDYEIKEWNEENFDVNIIPYTKEAYSVKKYAFVSDYARFWILYNYGGVYFDTDVEVIKPMDDIINNGAFMGCEYQLTPCVNPGLGLGAERGFEFGKEFLELYSKLQFIKSDGSLNLKTIVSYTTELLLSGGFINTNEIQDIKGLKIYPYEYFSPINTTSHRLHLTENTRTIHRYMASWQDNKERNWKTYFRKLLPEKFLLFYSKLKRH